MYNSDLPTRAELPSTAQLIKSTVIAICAAAAILVTIVLPAEHAIDPTGIGRLLKLTEMGTIKKQLAAEAEADRLRDQQQVPAKSDKRTDIGRTSLGSFFANLLISPAAAQTPPAAPAAAPAGQKDQTVIVLKPGEGTEYKAVMIKGAQLQYSWVVESGAVNFDMHGTIAGTDKETSYKKDRGAKKDEGVMTAGFDGTHGWFWRNRGDKDVKITLNTSGAYKDLAKVKK